jgi:hypothetical protein
MPQKMPNSDQQPAAPARPMPNDKLTTGVVDKADHLADFSRITGKLEYIHADGGLWVLRYASVGTEDQFGGSVVLAATVNMTNFREGDIVSVRGQVVGSGRASRSLGAPLYRPTAVEMVERAD